MVSTQRLRVETYLEGSSFSAMLAEDVRQGLTHPPRSLPPKYFYDAPGSLMFQQITRLPEYYLTRVEEQLLTSVAPQLYEHLRPQEILELGPGDSNKVSRLLASMNGHLRRYLPFDIDREGVHSLAQRLLQDHPSLEVHALVADFERHLPLVPPALGRRLVLFLGSTIGNLHPQAQRQFLAQVRGLLTTDSRLLLGVDLVKDRDVLDAAYNDSAGVTAAFNRNILRVVNRGVHADFQPDAFRHVAFYNEQAQRIEMHLAPESPQTVHLRDLGVTIQIAPEETIWTESSYKFTLSSTEAMLNAARLRLEEWTTDPEFRFALALAAPD